MDLLSGRTAALLVLGACFFAGGLTGCLCAGGIGGENAQQLEAYLRAYLELARDTGLEVSLPSLLWERMREPLAVLLLSFTAVGVSGIPAIFAGRGFLLGYSAACFCRIFGTWGLAPALVLFGLPGSLWAAALFLLGSRGMCASLILVGRGMGRLREPPSYGAPFWLDCLLGAGLLTVCVLLELLWVPGAVGKAAGFVLR